MLHKYSYSAGVNFTHQNLTLYRRQILTTKVDPCTVSYKDGPRTEKVNHCTALTNYLMQEIPLVPKGLNLLHQGILLVELTRSVVIINLMRSIMLGLEMVLVIFPIPHQRKRINMWVDPADQIGGTCWQIVDLLKYSNWTCSLSGYYTQ